MDECKLNRRTLLIGFVCVCMARSSAVWSALSDGCEAGDACLTWTE